MSTESLTFSQWLEDAGLSLQKLDEAKKASLQVAFQILQHNENDYASKRIAEHVLLHSGGQFKLAQIARLIGCSSRSLFRHKELSAKQVLQQIQHRLRGRPYGKLLPRHVGAIAQFLVQHPQASRLELLDFIHQTWGFRVSKVALWQYLNKFGLDRESLHDGPKPQTPTHHPAPSGEVQNSTPTNKESESSAAKAPVPNDSSTGCSTRPIIVSTPPTPCGVGLPLDVVSRGEDFFCPHPLRGRLFAVAASDGLARHRQGLFQR